MKTCPFNPPVRILTDDAYDPPKPETVITLDGTMSRHLTIAAPDADDLPDAALVLSLSVSLCDEDDQVYSSQSLTVQLSAVQVQGLRDAIDRYTRPADAPGVS